MRVCGKKTERQQLLLALKRAGIPYSWDDHGAVEIGGVILTFDPDGKFAHLDTPKHERVDRKVRRRSP